jgi:hypothetical protein
VRFCFLYQGGLQVKPAPVKQTPHREGEKEASPRTFLALPKIIAFGL